MLINTVRLSSRTRTDLTLVPSSSFKSLPSITRPYADDMSFSSLGNRMAGSDRFRTRCVVSISYCGSKRERRRTVDGGLVLVRAEFRFTHRH
ncbi:hypothetical protein BDN71DRAFT_662748 [Pleurotus eryngii]|uniref:Uncharacterized protein n=1 Tax=Pleurotus eryngii TaxID=5323 RepID=A0A9P5ZZL7_PLEER|nr:hypothetical protein BDN71DRAFT_662748 [Pleurotus eryngii]